jgi:hypothetical protein
MCSDSLGYIYKYIFAFIYIPHHHWDIDADLVDEVLEMLLRQLLTRAEDAIEITLHEVRDYVYVHEIDCIRGHSHDI